MNLGSNNNKKVVYRIAQASLNSSKLKTVFMTITIGLAICFVVILGLATLNYKTFEREAVKSMQDCIFYNASEEQINNLKKDENIKCVMTYKTGIEKNLGDIKINPVYYDYDMKDIRTYSFSAGKAPNKPNEIAIDIQALKAFGKTLEVGENIGILGENFTISGLLDNGKSLSYPVLFSKEYAETGKLFENCQTNALIKIVDNMKIPSSAYIKNFFFELGNRYGIERKNVNSNDKFVDSFSLNKDEILGFSILSVIVLIISGIVIYSIFYLSVSSKVREYAQLRTIGMTKKQMKKMIKIEGLNYCKFGIILGVILGSIISFFVIRDGYTILNVLKMAVVASFLGVIAVYISVSKPAKIASEVSPVEGLRYTGNDENISASNRLCRSLKPSSLGRIGFSKNRKKTLITLVSLSIGGVLFIFAVAFANSLDAMEYARSGNFSNSEYHISFTEEVKENSKNGLYDFIKEKNNLTELKNELENLEEIEKVKPSKSFNVTLEYKGEVMEDVIAPMNEKHTEAMTKALSEGTGDYNELKEKGEAYFIMGDVFEEIFGWKPEVGDTIKVHYFNGENQTLTLKLGGIANKNFSEENRDNPKADGWILIPDNIYNDIVGDIDSTSVLDVTTKNHIYNKEMDSKIKDIVRKYDGTQVITFTDYYEVSEKIVNDIGKCAIGLAAFIVLFSFINLINTVITSVVSRRKEIAILQSIGMSKNQVNKMIIFENIYLAIPSCVISSILGPVLTFVVIKIFWHFGAKYMFFHLPVVAILAYILISIAIPSIIAVYCIKMFNKQSIVDRLREN